MMRKKILKQKDTETYLKDYYSNSDTIKGYVKTKLFPSEKIIFKKYFNPKSGILDIGCGAGRTSIALTQMGYNITAFDLVPEMINQAKLSAKNQELKINFSVKNALDMDYKKESFQNVLFSFNGIENIQGKANREMLLRNVFEILKPGGCFIFTIRSAFAFGRRLIFWIWMVLTYPVKKIIFQNKSWELGDKVRDNLFIHYLNPFYLKKYSQKIGFELLCFNSSKNILNGKKANFFTNFSNDKLIYFVLKKENNFVRE
ncbi:class I SAM-dependent methyltransferase [candidate division KSB1 bacterium]|nr:class I SAM-dependent methyltransferase [candidate division KSB1 bacterium]MBL7093229.1 class I SAM-dependent methyltransferase [candidate division KSB1 bacterium]